MFSIHYSVSKIRESKAKRIILKNRITGFGQDFFKKRTQARIFGLQTEA